ncbi:DedA family protein [Metabacillus sp. Hm71]|uniref:DedA family protein n=1 Tax=Metabacillus sp. Hm71 TaxID=3450743 RepID=UPI003F4375E2
MIEFILNTLNTLGVWGLFIGVALEAASLPFPGMLFVLTYGYLLKPSWGILVLLTIAGSLVYTIFSYIPYFIGLKLQDTLKKEKYEKKIKRAKGWFDKYGEWTISFSRMIGVGNYISYFSGMIKVHPWKYGVLTYIGILPWVLFMLILGRAGIIKTVMELFTSIQKYLVIGLFLGLILYLVYRIKKNPEKSTN